MSSRERKYLLEEDIGGFKSFKKSGVSGASLDSEEMLRLEVAEAGGGAIEEKLWRKIQRERHEHLRSATA